MPRRRRPRRPRAEHSDRRGRRRRRPQRRRDDLDVVPVHEGAGQAGQARERRDALGGHRRRHVRADQPRRVGGEERHAERGGELRGNRAFTRADGADQLELDRGRRRGTAERVDEGAQRREFGWIEAGRRRRGGGHDLDGARERRLGDRAVDEPSDEGGIGAPRDAGAPRIRAAVGRTREPPPPDRRRRADPDAGRPLEKRGRQPRRGRAERGVVVQVAVDAAEERLDVGGDRERQEVHLVIGEAECLAHAPPARLAGGATIRVGDQLAEPSRRRVGCVEARLGRPQRPGVGEDAIDVGVRDRQALRARIVGARPQETHPEDTPVGAQPDALERGRLDGGRAYPGLDHVGRAPHHSVTHQAGGDSTPLTRTRTV